MVIKYYTLYCIVFVLAGCQGKPAINTEKPLLTLDTAPWKTEGSEICVRNSKTGLRAHIFPPIYETKFEPTPAHLTGTEIIFIPGHNLADGSKIRGSIRERVIPNLYHPPTYRSLKRQTVGYLTDKNEWVSERGEPVFAFENFHTMQGIPGMPIETVLETAVVKTNLQSNQDDYLRIKTSVKTAPPCTYIEIPATYKIIKETVEYRERTKTLTCGATGNVEQNPPYTYSRTLTRSVRINDKSVLFTNIYGNFDEGADAWLQADKLSHQGQFCDWVHLDKRP